MIIGELQPSPENHKVVEGGEGRKSIRSMSIRFSGGVTTGIFHEKNITYNTSNGARLCSCASFDGYNRLSR